MNSSHYYTNDFGHRNQQSYKQPNSPITKLKIVHTVNDVNYEVNEIYRKCENFPVIGLDCEWTATTVKKQRPDVAVVQIATHDGYCVLFRTCFMQQLPTSLLKLLRDPQILKVGVGIYQDGEFLREKFPEASIKARFDLRHLARFCNVFSPGESLKDLTKSLLKFELQKQKGNVLSYVWEVKELNPEMAHYAALDALAGVLIFEKLLPLFHEQETDEQFNSVSPAILVQNYFLNNDSPCFTFLDTKL